MFLSLDGIDGTGKSTQIGLLCQWLREQGRDVVLCRDPGSTPLGEAIRKVLLDRHDLSIGVRSEMFLYMAARAQLVDEIIAPAMAAGKTIVSDRYLLANLVYQGYAGGLDVEELRRIGDFATASLIPDLCILLDMPTEAAARRIQREPDRMERKDTAYRERLRQGFLMEAARRPEAIAVIDADRSIDAVHADIRAAVERIARDQARKQLP